MHNSAYGFVFYLDVLGTYPVNRKAAAVGICSTMQLVYPVKCLRNSLLFSGGLGILLGFIVSDTFISYHSSKEGTVSIGDIELDNNEVMTNNSDVERSSKRIKVYCMVLSSLDENGKDAKAVKQTWGKRCDKLQFFTSRQDAHLETVLIPKNINDTRDTLWEKVKFGFSHAYSNHYDFDWFLKADEDTYVVMENLKVYLSGYNASEAKFFGCRFKGKASYDLNRFREDPDLPTGYMSGGAGYVLSREALKRFVEEALSDTKCQSYLSWAEDVNMGRCLDEVNVEFMDTRDYLGRIRFFPLMPYDAGYLQPGRFKHNFWYYDKMYYRTDEGPNCCAESAITFHYAAKFMYQIDFFLYHLSPYQN